MNGHYASNSRYASSANNFDPNFKFCSFCKGDVSRRDNLRFSHWLFDKETKLLTCPFLQSTICHVCLDTGHTTSKCPNAMRLQEMHMAAMSVDPNSSHAIIARLEFEKEIERRMMVKAYLDMDKHCSFCANGDYRDEFYKTHTLNRCPRLACSTCAYCGDKGHTKSKCPVKANVELWKISDPGCTEFILDFDAEEAAESAARA